MGCCTSTQLRRVVTADSLLGTTGIGRIVEAEDWRHATPLFPFYKNNFAVFDQYVSLKRRSASRGGDSELLEMAGTTLFIGVSLLHSKTEFVYATAGLSNMFLLCQAMEGIPRVHRSFGTELVIRLRKTREQAKLGASCKHPRWPVDVLLEVMRQKMRRPLPPLRPCDTGALDLDPAVETTLTHFVLVPAEYREDGVFSTVLDDVHGEVTFLQMKLITSEENEWCTTFGADDFVDRAREIEGSDFGTSELLREGLPISHPTLLL